jgi:hypothetical protein
VPDEHPAPAVGGRAKESIGLLRRADEGLLDQRVLSARDVELGQARVMLGRGRDEHRVGLAHVVGGG